MNTERSCPPNIVFLFSDQQRWDTCGCYGQPLNLTPHLDRIAAEGVRGEHAFTCQPVCGPARACLQTGKYATEVGCHINHCRLPENEKTIAHWIGGAGYDTAYIGKWHLASCGPKNGPDDFRELPVPPDRRGGYKEWLAADVLEFTSHAYDGHVFDGAGERRDFPAGRYRADALTDWALDYLRTREADKPFFLFVSFVEPHHQNDHKHYEGPHGSKERFKDFVVPGDLVDTKGDWRTEYPDYLGCVQALDANVGRIDAALRDRGLADNTLLIYTSDHGSHFRTRTAEYKRACHDACIRVPLILRGPGFTGGQARSELVSLIDLPPTLLRAAGVTPPPEMRGRPLQELLEGRAASWPEEVFLQISESQCGRAIRTRQWKYSVFAPDRTGADPASDWYEEEYLYNLDSDPHERHNLVRDSACADIRRELAERLKQRMQAAGEAVPDIRPARALEHPDS